MHKNCAKNTMNRNYTNNRMHRNYANNTMHRNYANNTMHLMQYNAKNSMHVIKLCQHLQYV